MSKFARKFKGPAKKGGVRAAPGATDVSPTKNFFNTEIEAQTASAGPPLGPLLGKFGLNIGNFCKDFNAKTKHIKQGIPLPVTVRINPDRTYKLEIGAPSTLYFIKQAAGIEETKYPDEPTAAGKITIKHAYEISKIKHEDPFSRLQVMDLKEVVKRTVGIATINGIEVVKDLDPDEYKIFLAERQKYIEERTKRLEAEMKAKLQRSQVS